MHKSTHQAIFMAILLSFLTFSFGFAQSGDAKAQLDRQLEQDEKAGGKSNKKTTKAQRPKSALEVQCESFNDPHDQAVCFKAQSKELAKRASEANKQAKNSEPNSMKEVRREDSKKEKDAQRAEQDEARTANNAEITGCEPGSVWVSRRAVQRSSWRVMTTVRVTNSGALPVDIESPLYGGLIVKNLRSGCSATLSFVLRWEDSDQVQIPLTAISRPEDGGVAIEQFQTYLNRYDIQYNRVRSQTWMVRVQRQYQTR